VPLALLLLAAAPAAPAPAPADERLLVLDVRSSAASPDEIAALTAAVARGASRATTVPVVSGGELRALMSVEATKQAAGCEADNCLAEIADALGASVVLSTSLAQLGSQLVADLALFDRQTASVVAREQVTAAGVAELPEGLARAAERLVTGALARKPLPFAPMALVGAGALSGVGGALLAGWSAAVQNDPRSLGADKEVLEPLWPIGLVVAGVGVAAVAGGAVWLAVAP
jgi:hypothetical protein